MARIHRAIAVLRLSYTVAILITQAKAIIQAMTGNAFFPNLSPLLTQIQGLLDDLHVAAGTAKLKTLGAVDARTVKRNLLISALQQLRAGVQAVADSMPAQAEEIIKSAGMGVKRVTPRQKNKFTATQGDISGLVLLLAARAAHAACYEWEWSVDQHTWTPLTPTMQANASVSGLTPATTYSFRYRAVTRTGRGDWSQIVTLLVK